jgi:hypothetical protein
LKRSKTILSDKSRTSILVEIKLNFDQSNTASFWYHSHPENWHGTLLVFYWYKNVTKQNCSGFIRIYVWDAKAASASVEQMDVVLLFCFLVRVRVEAAS